MKILDILKKEYIIRKTRDNLKTKDFTIAYSIVGAADGLTITPD